MNAPATQSGMVIQEMNGDRAHRVLEAFTQPGEDSWKYFYDLMHAILTGERAANELEAYFLEECDSIRMNQEEVEKEYV